MSNLRESILPLLWIYRVTGLAVFQMPESVSWSKSTGVYVVALGLSYSYVLWSSLTISIETIIMVPLVVLIFQFILLSNVVAAVSSSVLFWLNRKDIIEFLKRITLADETLQSFGIDPKYKREQKENLRVVVYWLIAITTLFISGIVIQYNVWDSARDLLIETVSFFWPQVINILIELTFFIQLALVQKRFEKLNALIYNAMKNSSQTESYQNIDKYSNILLDNQTYNESIASYYEKNRNDLEFLLRITRQLHLELCSISQLLNRAMGKQIAILIAVKFASLVGYSYCFYLLYKENNLLSNIKISFCTYVVIRIIYSTTGLLLTIRISENIAAEAQLTSQLIQEIEDVRTRIIDEIHQYSLQIMHNPLRFTACGLYVLDFNFLQSFVGSVAFYLIILIQNQPSIAKKAGAMITESNFSTNTSA